MEEKIRSILSAILEVEPASIDGGFGPHSCQSWDSLSNLRIIAALEKEFSLRFTWPEINSMTDFSRIRQVVGSRAAGAPSREGA